jgi:hypothetical protein
MSTTNRGSGTILAGEIDRREFTVGQRHKEQRLDPCTGLAVEQVAHFCGDSPRDEQSPIRKV